MFKLTGFGPGGSSTAGNWGIGANYEYGDEQITHLLPGSSGSSGRLFQGSGAGGGALAIHADGDILIADGVFISANGGDARADGIYDHGGGGSGGAIRLVAKNIYNKGDLNNDFFINILRTKRRFSPWIRKDLVDNLDCVKRYYGYSNEKAKQALKILSKEQLDFIKSKFEIGGT